MKTNIMQAEIDFRREIANNFFNDPVGFLPDGTFMHHMCGECMSCGWINKELTLSYLCLKCREKERFNNVETIQSQKDTKNVY